MFLLTSLSFPVPPFSSRADGVALGEGGDQSEGRRINGHLCRRLYDGVGLCKERNKSQRRRDLGEIV